MLSLKITREKVLLIVNVASKCGATPQYKDLQALEAQYGKKGLKVLGFPCNQFGKQEPKSNADIKDFCTTKFKVTFDMFSKIDVNGKSADPLYSYLTSKETNPNHSGKVKWNFEKFLINSKGEIVNRFRTRVKPTDKEVISAIEAELAHIKK